MKEIDVHVFTGFVQCIYYSYLLGHVHCDLNDSVMLYIQIN